ncbi:MAG TPA: class I SAM-dependent methyltransferase, partial [Kofleriaceae bacterium]
MQPARRLELGQWFTPPEVADLALALAGCSGRVLDPACGDGVFLARARAAGVPAADLVGVELDPAAAAAARAALPGVRVEQGDLFDFEPDARGYDLVVGNPPYVRQERIAPRQKERVRRRLAADWPDLPATEIERLVGRGDLAVAVLARALRLCRTGGRVAMVVSSALLDAGYARPLWRLVERVGHLVAVVEAPGERWFADAAVNA